MPSPTISSITPDNGSQAGGTAVTIAGTGFVDLSADGVTFDGVAATDFVVVNDLEITCTTPAHAVGAVDVVVNTPASGTATLAGGFTYTVAVVDPTVTSVSPDSGPTAGGTAITITGTGFLAGAAVLIGASAATSIVVVSDTSITCVTPAGTSDSVVTVTNTDLGVGTLVSGFTYVAPPVVTAVSPAEGTTAGGEITITGTGFLTGATVTIGGVACTGVAVVSATEITCTAPASTAGLRDVTVTNTDTQSSTLTLGFEYLREGTLEKLLPPGPLWNLEQDSDLSDTLRAMGDEFARVQARGADLVGESDPRTATETLAEWEQALGLPDDIVTEIPATTAGRRVAVTQKYIARGGATEDFYTTLVAACGWILDSIVLFAGAAQARAGHRVGQRLYGTAYAYAMELKISADPGTKLTEAELEAVLSKATHSHIQVVFTYL